MAAKGARGGRDKRERPHLLSLVAQLPAFIVKALLQLVDLVLQGGRTRLHRPTKTALAAALVAVAARAQQLLPRAPERLKLARGPQLRPPKRAIGRRWLRLGFQLEPQAVLQRLALDDRLPIAEGSRKASERRAVEDRVDLALKDQLMTAREATVAGESK